MSSTTTLQELATQLTNAVAGGNLVLNSTVVTAPTFGWSLQTMGVTTLTVQIPDPSTGIVYDAGKATLTITGNCIPYSGWTATVYTIVLSSGDSGNTVLYANTNISANYASFNIQQVASSGLIPSGSVVGSLLPNYNMSNVPMSVISTSASTLPNCTLNFGTNASPISPAWDIVASLGLSMDTLGFVVANSMNKNAVITNAFSLSGGVSIGSIEVNITVTLPVDNFSQSGIWSLAFSSEVGATGLNIANLVQNLGGVNVYQEFPASLTALLEFTLTYFYVQFDPADLSVNQIVINIGAPTWAVIPEQFSITDTNFGVQVYNPFDSVSRSTTLFVNGTFIVGSEENPAAKLSASATLPLGNSDWFFNITGEINNVNYTTLVASTPGMDTYPPPAAPNGFNLEKIILNYLNISYNPTSNTLSEVDLSVDSILEFPVIPGIIGVKDPYFSLSLTNPLSSANNNYSGTVGGTVTLTNAPFLDLEASVAKNTGWVFSAGLSPGVTINIIDLLDQFFEKNSTVPSWVGSTLEISAFELIVKTPPSGQSTPPNEYIVSGTVNWQLVVGAFNLPPASATVMVDYQDPNVSGSITVTTTLFGLDFLIGYKFGSAETDVYLVWNGITAKYTSTNEYSQYSLTVSNLSLGGLITSVMSDIIPGFTLDAPWNLLNDINLNGLSIVCKQYVATADQSKNSLIVSIPINLNLGFMDIKSVKLTRIGSGTGAETYLGFEGTFLGFTISPDSPNEGAQQLAGQGSNVQNMPSVPGLGGNIFDLKYFGLGQHVTIYPTTNFTNVSSAVDGLKRVFSNPPQAPAGQPPIIPIPPKPNSTPQQTMLIFDGTSNWLVGLQCVIMNTVKLGVVFNDPNLYGLAINLSGESAGIFDGLDFEILYKKVNDSIGVYQIDLQLPAAMRTLELGEVSITLPSASIQIYTNGNFMVDLGFPWNNDFSRSFTVQVFPFIGQGGFYFGVLNGATSTNVPSTQVGNFNPVIELGVGLSLGVGKTINEGILSAGLSLMAVGVFQGVLARFNVNDTNLYWGDGDYYFKAKGTFGITGRIYGSVNFAIISASFDITAYAYITITLESYNLIDISFTAGISISLKVTVNLGLFKISITLKFSATISASFTIGTDNRANAPWNQLPKTAMAARSMAMRTALLETGNSYNILWQPLLQSQKTDLTIMFLPLLSLSSAGGSTKAQFVNLLFIDAPDPSDTNAPLNTGFTTLTTAILQWAINAIVNSGTTNTTVENLMKQSVTLDQLQAIYCYLTYESEDFFPIMYSNTKDGVAYDIRAFLQNYFNITIQADNIDDQDTSSATVFPMFPDLKLNDELGGKTQTSVDFSANPQPFSYLDEVQEQLQQLAVQYQSAAESANDNPDDCPTVTDSSLPNTPPDVSFATFIIQDYFEMIVKNAVQDAIDSFDNYAYPVSASVTLGDVVNYFTSPPLNNQITAAQIVQQNASVNLVSGQPFNLSGITYPVAAGNTFDAIVALYNAHLTQENQLTAADLGTLSNSAINGLVLEGTVITVGSNAPYTVIATDTLATIAESIDPVNKSVSVADVINAIANQPVLATLAVIEIPTMVYATGDSDNFESISGVFGVTTDVLAAANPQVTFNAESLSVPGITTLGVQDVINQVITLKNINSYASMTARFLLHGLNLPDPEDTTEVEPLYVLTGQQIVVPTLVQNDVYNIELTPGANGSWIGLASNPLLLNVDNNEISRINDVLSINLTQSTSEQPPAPIALYQDAFQTFTLKSPLSWQYPGLLALPVGTPPTQVVGTPSLWYFPDTLTGVLQDTQQTNLQLDLLLQTLNADGNTYTQSAIQNYGWATLINISVEQITDSNEQAPVFANTYNLSGASGGDIVYLERIVAALNSGNGPKVDQIRILYDPNPTGNASTDGIQSVADGAYEIGVVKVNLSTETNPEVSAARLALARTEDAYVPPTPNTLNDYTEFLSFVWECSIVRSGGFYLYFHQTDGSALPDSLFSDTPVANLYLLVTYQGAPSGDYLNAVAVGDQIDTSKSVLFVQSETLTTRNALLPAGNSGFQLTIDNPGAYTPINPYPIPATPASKESDTLFLQNQFNLISYQLVENATFNASPESLMPAGPLNSSNPGDGEQEENNVDDDTSNWPYQGTLPVFSYAKSQIQPTNPAYPPASGDPYGGIGGSAQIQLSLVDLFGNPINSNISGSNGQITAPINYTDNLIALSQWPGVTSRYSFPVIGGKPNIQLDLCFDTSRYTNTDSDVSPQDLALADMGTYASIYYQLIQPDIQISYRTTLYTSADYEDGVPLTPNQNLSDFAGTIYAYLANIANGKTQDVTVPVPWSITAEVDASNMSNIYELITELTILRTKNISPDFTDVPAVTSVTTVIPPITQAACTSDASSSASLTYFATILEDTFSATPVAGSFLKVASGVDSENVSSNGNNQKVWIARFDTAGKYGMNVSFNKTGSTPDAYYYSPAPLSTSLLTLNSVPITNYVSGTPFAYNPKAAGKNFSAVDMDQWAITCLQAIDNFLSPQYSVPAFLIDNGVTLQAVLDAKQSLADYITGTVTNILDQPLDDAQIANAQDAFNQQLLISLGNAYNITTIVQHPVTVDSQYSGSNKAPYTSEPINPRLYGSIYGVDPKPVGSIGSNEADVSNQYSFTNSKIPLGTGASWVNYCLYVKDASQVESFSFSNIDFILSNIEHQIENVENVEGYQASTWLAFVIPLSTDTFATDGPVDMPVPLRAYPVPPSVTAQNAEYDQNNVTGETTTIDAALTWGFDFTYSQQEATQDIINAQVAFNTSTAPLLGGDPSDTITLPDAMAQFISALPGLTADFLAYVAQVTPADVSAQNETAKSALSAVQSLGTLANLLAEGWSTYNQFNPWPQQPQMQAFAKPKLKVGYSGVEFNYTIDETESNTGDPSSPMTLTVSAVTGNPGGLSLPMVTIGTYTTETIDVSETSVSYQFKDGDNYLSYADRQQVNTRTLALTPLQLMEYQEGWAGVQITRNKDLVPEFQTNQKFLYQTPLVRFYTPLVPLLTANAQIDISAINQTGKPQANYLAVQLQNLFNAIFANYELGNPTIRLEVLYSYNLSGDTSWNQISMPIFLALPFPLQLPQDLQIGDGVPYCSTTSSFLCTVNSALTTWYQQNTPSQQNGQFTFRLTIYSATDDTTPLLTLNNLSLLITQITDFES